MAYELWALDAGAGEAILREESHWYLAALDRGWKPVELEAPQGIIGWSLSRHVVPIGREYETRDEAVSMARKVCLAAWSSGSFSSEEIQHLVANIQKSEVRRRDPARWAGINREALILDGYFQEQGCTKEESLQLILLTLERLRQSQEWTKSGRELSLSLQRLARAVYLETGAESDRAQAPGYGLSEYDRELLARALRRLPFEVLSILTLWADSSYDEDEIAVILRVSPEAVRQSIHIAVAALDRSPGELRAPAFAEVCKEVVHARS
jgi:hypothetical protein